MSSRLGWRVSVVSSCRCFAPSRSLCPSPSSTDTSTVPTWLWSPWWRRTWWEHRTCPLHLAWSTSSTPSPTSSARPSEVRETTHAHDTSQHPSRHPKNSSNVFVHTVFFLVSIHISFYWSSWWAGGDLIFRVKYLRPQQEIIASCRSGWITPSTSQCGQANWSVSVSDTLATWVQRAELVSNMFSSHHKHWLSG